MKGCTRIILNDETICQMVQAHINEHVLREEHICTKVDYDYQGQTRIVFAIIEPTPVVDKPKETP